MNILDASIKGAQSIYRVFHLLDYIFDNPEGSSLTQISTHSGLNPSTVFRMLAVLQDLGYVRKGDDDVYRPGFKPLLLAEKLRSALDVRTVARPALEELSKKTREVCHLVILDGTEAVYVDKVEDDSHSIRMNSRVGARVPLHCTAVGKVLLAGLGGAEFESILGKLDLKRYTENTIATPDSLRHAVEEVRRRGHAFDRVEYENLIKCVAAPIYDATNRVKAAISISVPEMRFPQEREAEILAALLDGCKKISSLLGCSIV